MTTRTLNKRNGRPAATIKTPGRHSDGGGLYLSIDPQGRRRWVFTYTRNRKRTGLGWGGAGLTYSGVPVSSSSTAWGHRTAGSRTAARATR